MDWVRQIHKLHRYNPERICKAVTMCTRISQYDLIQLLNQLAWASFHLRYRLYFPVKIKIDKNQKTIYEGEK